MGVLAGLQQQAVECEELGSSMYAELVRLMVDDYELGGATAGVLEGFEGHPKDDSVALPLLAGVHRLVLAGEAPELAGFYPSVGGVWDPVLGWEAFAQVLRSRVGELRAAVLQQPQTNEVRRSVALYGGLLQLVHAIPLPVRLCEIGSSAGLNLRADHFRFNLADGTSYGAVESPVVIEAAWSGREVPRAALRIAERVGSDIAPVNALTAEGAQTLTSYVWADQVERLARLRGALAIAREVPVDLRREDAVSFVRGLELSEGHVTVLWHSIMWTYLTPEEQAAVDAALDALGAQATESAPLARLRLEPPGEWGDEFLVELQTWPGGVRQVLGRADPHGQGMVWELPFDVKERLA